MSIETEAKFRVDSLAAIRESLASLGADSLGTVLETNRIYDRPDGSLRARGCGLRVRSARSSDGATATTLTFKGPVTAGPYKSREELEVVVDDAETLVRMLVPLGFVPILLYEKRRESWRFRDCRIELDEPPHIGLFVEIEGPDVRAVRSTAEALKLGDASHVRESYVRLLMRYCNEIGIAPRVLRLPPTDAITDRPPP